MPNRKIRFTLIACLFLTCLDAPAGARSTPERCAAHDQADSPAVHGTAQATVNAHGQLVLGVDRRLSEACAPDGRAELVFLFQPRRTGDVKDLVEALEEPREDIGVAHRGNAIRVTLPDARTWMLAMRDGQDATDAAMIVDGLAVSRVDRGIRATGLEETLSEYRDFDLMRGPGDD